MCEKLLRSVDNSDAELVLCGFHHLFVNKDIIKVPKGGSYTFQKEPEQFLRLYEAGFLNMPWNKLFKRELLDSQFDTSLSLGEDLLFNLAYLKKIENIAVLEEPLYYYIQQKGTDTLSSKKREDKYELAVRICEEVKEFYHFLIENEPKERKLALQKAGECVIHKRLILEFLDEIEGMAYDKTMTKQQKLATIQKYMTDSYIRNAGAEIGQLQIDYAVIHFCLRRKWKHVIYLLIYLRKWCLNLVTK
jgi:hypothetical protein